MARRTKQEIYSDPSTRPDVLTFLPDGIPPLLVECPRWVTWRLEWKPNKDGSGKWDKPLYRPNGKHAMSNMAATWSSFDEVVKAYQAGGFDGCGFVLGDGWTGLDLDNVRDTETGSIFRPWATELIRSAGIYADTSPSGTGVKLIGRAKWARGKNSRLKHKDGGEVEVHIRQYFTLTGRPA